MLVRPYPSLRITFTSPAMRIPGLVQSRFMDRIGGPQHIREGLLEALTQGVGVTARISWLTHSAQANRNSAQGKPRWVHCTPLLGSDENVGVWMIGMFNLRPELVFTDRATVMIEKEEITGSFHREMLASPAPILMSPMSSLALTNRRGHTPISERYGGSQLYAQYLREGKVGPSSSEEEIQPRIDSARDSNSESRDTCHDPDEDVLEF
jgi:hypothetical protein